MKTFLKCTNCGNLNEIKSEYMVLCTFCGKRMNNNFTEWKKNHPGNSFEEYKQIIGIGENQLPPEVPKKKKNSLKSRSIKEKILIVVITAISAALGGWLADVAISSIRNNKKTSENILNQEWIKKEYGNYTLKIETPFELVRLKQSPEELSQLKELVEEIEMYESSDDNSIKIFLNITNYKPETALNLQGAANGTISGLKNQPSVSDFIYDEQAYERNSIPGFIQKGSFKIQGQEVAFTSIGLLNENIYYQLIISTSPNDDVAKKAADRIMNSVEIF
ncbi:MAG: hypothetical protein PHV53_01020 [Fermentimonas sp.]|nr:hypothetical protein [Fermentimonas sp.]